MAKVKIESKKLQDHIDIEQIAKLIRDPQANSTVLEIEDHKSKERIVISIIGHEPEAIR